MDLFTSLYEKFFGRRLTPTELEAAQLKMIAEKFNMTEDHVRKRWEEFQIKSYKHAIKQTKKKTKLIKKHKSQKRTAFSKFFKG